MLFDQDAPIIYHTHTSSVVHPVHRRSRGYAERQKIYGVLVTGVMMNIFMTPQILGTGATPVVRRGVSIHDDVDCITSDRPCFSMTCGRLPTVTALLL